MKIRLVERGALLTFCTISRQSVTLCSLFTQKQHSAPRSSNFLYDFTPERHALFTFLRKNSTARHAPATFQAISRQRATLCSFLSKKLLFGIISYKTF